MIDLGRIPLAHDRSVYDARNKIRVLASALGFDSIQTTRLSTAISTAARTLATENGDAGIRVALTTDHSPPQLVLDLEYPGEPPPFSNLTAFFDQLVSSNADAGSVRAFKTIPAEAPVKLPKGTTVTFGEFIERQRSMDYEIRETYHADKA